MPAYDYMCPICGDVKEVIHSIKEDPTIICESCSSEKGPAKMARKISGSINFFIKGGSADVHYREKQRRMKRSNEQAFKQIDRYGGSSPKLVPNVGGKEVESWSDAAKIAKDMGKNSDTYKPLIAAEKHTSKVSGVNDKKWKEAKENKNK